MDKNLLILKKARPGIGGLHCNCCNPAFGKFRGEGSQENRKAAKRAFRRSDRHAYKDAGANELHALILEQIKEIEQLEVDMAMELDYLLTPPFDPYEMFLEPAHKYNMFLPFDGHDPHADPFDEFADMVF